MLMTGRCNCLEYFNLPHTRRMIVVIDATLSVEHETN
jgi:hypothetical protein